MSVKAPAFQGLSRSDAQRGETEAFRKEASPEDSNSPDAGFGKASPGLSNRVPTGRISVKMPGRGAFQNRPTGGEICKRLRREPRKYSAEGDVENHHKYKAEHEAADPADIAG